MSSSRPFRLIDAVAAVVLVALLLATVFAADEKGDNRQRARQREHMTRLRGIHNGAILFAQGNNDYYPGLDARGQESKTKIVTGDTNYGAGKATGNTPAYRYALLLNGGYFTPEWSISPLETEKKKPVKAFQEDVTSDNFSFAMLRLSDRKASGRVAEWTNTTNSQAAAMGDRNLADKAGKNAESIIGGKDKPWTGAVAWNDNHITMEKSNTLNLTRSAGAPPVNNDDLFADDKDSDGNAGNDAAMVFHDADSYVKQK